MSMFSSIRAAFGIQSESSLQSSASLAGSMTASKRKAKVDGGPKAAAMQTVHYPGYDPHIPFGLPRQEQQDIDHHLLLRQSARRNLAALDIYQAGPVFQKMVMSHSSAEFFLDAYWWFFLELFSEIDLDRILKDLQRREQAEKEAQEALPGMASLILPSPSSRGDAGSKDKTPFAPKPPPADIPGSTRPTPNLPVHLSRSLKPPTRKAENIARVASPRVHHEDALPMIQSTVEAPLEHHHHPEPFAASEGPSPLPLTTFSPPLPQFDESRAATVLRATSVQEAMLSAELQRSGPIMNLATLPPDERQQLVCREQQKLFSRMSVSYWRLMQVMPNHLLPCTKDILYTMYPDAIAQTLFIAFYRSIPFARDLFQRDFQLRLLHTINYWTTGIERGVPDAWPLPQSLAGTSQGVSGRRKSSGQPKANTKDAKPSKADNAKASPRSQRDNVVTLPSPFATSRKASLVKEVPIRVASRRVSITDGSTSAGSTSRVMQAQGITPTKTTSTSRLSRRDSSGNQSTGSSASLAATPSVQQTGHAVEHVPHPPKEPYQPSNKAHAALSAVARLQATNKQTSLHKEIERLKYDMRHPNGTAKAVLEASEATKAALAAVPTTETASDANPRSQYTVRLMKKEHPWYLQGTRSRTTTTGGLPQAKARFSLSEWSPLTHRFLLLQGADNIRSSCVMSWTPALPARAVEESK